MTITPSLVFSKKFGEPNPEHAIELIKLFEESCVSTNSFQALTELTKNLNSNLASQTTQSYDDDVTADDVVTNFRRAFFDLTSEFHDVFITQVVDPSDICVRLQKFDLQLKKLESDLEEFWNKNVENRY